MELDFKIFTLNCWGIPLISKNLNDRFEAIGDFLGNSNYDCVCLQEVWDDGQFERIRAKVSKKLPYGHYFFSGSMGSGICMLSKYPIVDVYYHQWPVNGYMHKIHHGDWFGGKGVGLCKIRLDKYLINVYTAHLHAEYDREHDEYKAHRVIQAYDTAQFIHFTSGGADLVVLAGDLNTEPGDLAYKLVLTIPGLTDSFVKAQLPEGLRWTTNESLCNSYTPSTLKKHEVCGKRIDYIMYHPGSRLQVHLKNYEMPLDDKIPGKTFSYSDHEGVAAILHINGDSATPPVEEYTQKILTLKESIEVLQNEVETLKSHKRFYWLCAIFPFCLFLVTIVVDVPANLSIIYNIFRSLLAIVVLFFCVMATIWNSIEYRGVLSNLLSMRVYLERLNNEKLKS